MRYKLWWGVVYMTYNTHTHTHTHTHTYTHTHIHTHSHTHLSWLPSFHSLLPHLTSGWSVEGCSWWREGVGRRSWAFVAFSSAPFTVGECMASWYVCLLWQVCYPGRWCVRVRVDLYVCVCEGGTQSVHQDLQSKRHTNNSCHAPIITYTTVLSPFCSKRDLFS